MRLRPALVLAALAAGVVAGGCRGGADQEPRASAQSRPIGAAGFDWARGPLRDLGVETVFRAAREHGLAAAQDELERLARRDERVRAMGHQVAHTLGRFAVAGSGYDARRFAECRPNFQSGCYHGVLEAYLERAPLDARSLGALCDTITGRGGPRLQYLECAHGLGHGLTVRHAHDIVPALAACDHLAAADGRGECHDGVFMENVVHGLGEGALHAGGSAAHDGHAGGAGTTRFLRRDDPYFPCDSVAPRYQPSCWTYQNRVIRALNGDDFTTTLRACGRVSPASRPSCARGFGKQVGGASPKEVAQTVAFCRAASAALAGWCIAGAAEYYIDLDWKTEPAHQFCARVPAGLQPSCYRMIGSRLVLMHTTPEPVRRDCRRARRRENVAACLEGAELSSESV